MLLGALGASLFGNILAGKGINRAVEWFVRVSYRNKKVQKTITKKKKNFYCRFIL